MTTKSICVALATSLLLACAADGGGEPGATEDVPVRIDLADEAPSDGTAYVEVRNPSADERIYQAFRASGEVVVTIDLHADKSHTTWHVAIDGDEVHQERTLVVAPRTDARDALHPRTRAECMGGARNALAQCKYGAETGDWGPFYDWVDYLLAHC